MSILVINSGSTSLKYKLFNNKLKVLNKGLIEGIGGKVKNHHQALSLALLNLKSQIKDIKVVGHRVVHSGGQFSKPTKINQKILDKLQKYNQLAPLHNPPNLEGIKACFKLLPRIPNIAVFDTAFYHNLPEKAYIYGLPYYYQKYNLRRFGFHGISHQYVTQEAAHKLKKPLKNLNLITCHLGGGASITAIKNGKAVDTSMGFTPLEGLLMMTRPGDIDSGLLLFLAEKENLSFKKLAEILNHQSGVLGISGISDDMREVLKHAKKGNRKARLALDIFCYRVQKYIGAYFAILSKVDALVFTGAIGFGSKEIRNKITKDLKILKGVKVLVISTDEEFQIAQEVLKFIK